MMNIERSRRTPQEINLTSLIDVMFMLMIFFILTTNYVDIEALKLAVVEDGTKSKTTSAAVKSHDVVLMSSGTTFVNGVLIYYGDLEEKMEVIFMRAPDVPVTVKCDDSVNVQMLVEVLDMVKRTGGKDVRVARLNEMNIVQGDDQK